MTAEKDLNQKIKEWWEKHPFTLGAGEGDYGKRDLVGAVSLEKIDAGYFSEIERKFRKHSGTGAQEEGQPLLSKLVDLRGFKGKKVLDVATGPGVHLVPYAEAGAEVVGIDLTQYAVFQAKKNLLLRGLKGEVLEMDAQEMSFSNETFDFVHAWGCLMHMPNTEKAIKEIYRVLKPGGGVLAYMYNRSSWPFWFNIILLRGILLGGLIRFKGNIDKLTSRYSDGASLGGNMLAKFYRPVTVRKMFEQAGFSEVLVGPWDIGYEADHWPMRKFPVFKYLPRSLKRLMSKKWGYGLIVHAKR